MMGLIEQEAEDGDCAGANGEEEEEEQEPKATGRRSYPRPKYMESAWGQWLRKLEELHSSEGGLRRGLPGGTAVRRCFSSPLPDVPGHRRGRGACISSCSTRRRWPGVHSRGIEGAFSVHGAFCTLYNGLRV